MSFTESFTEKEIKILGEKFSNWFILADYRIPGICLLPHELHAAQEICKVMLAKYPAPFCAYWTRVEPDKSERYEFTMYSHGDFDVSEIARQFGGSGSQRSAKFMALLSVVHLD